MRWLLIATFFAARICAASPDTEEQQKIATAVEALTRLENINLEEKPAVKAAVNGVLEKTRGTPDFLRLVQHFKLTNQNEALLALAIHQSTNETGVAALRLMLGNNDSATVKQALQTSKAMDAVRLVEALGNAKEKQAVPWLVPWLTNSTGNVEMRRATVRALAQTQDGAVALLALAKADTLPENLKFVAATELNAVRWPEIKAAAAKILPLPAGQNSQPLPPVSELIKLKGNAAKGAEIFRRETTGCIKCHQVRGEGRELGPALSEIGTKLSKEALYEAILDPSAGISFGFEAWQVQLKSGDEAYGIKASDTPDEIAIKDTNGIITRHKRNQIASMQQMKTSIMPAGLQQTMTTQELVDLVEYLFSLKKQP